MPDTGSLRGSSVSLSQHFAPLPQPQPQPQPQPRCQLSPQPQPPDTQAHVDLREACRYLHRHCVHSKVESIFSNLLSERPEDPLLYIVEHLRLSSGKASNELQVDINDSNKPNGDRSGSSEEPSEYNSARRDGHSFSVSSKEESTIEAKVHNTPTTGDETLVRNPINTLRTSVAAGVSLGEGPISTPSNETPMLHTISGGLFPPGVQNQMTPTPIDITPPEGYVQNIPTSLCSTRTNLCILHPSTAVFAPWTASLRSSLGGNSLEHDDSTRSDISAFSVASVDVQEFLQEFRSVKAELVGAETRLVDIEVLSEILQRVNIPLPDVSLIADLFDEVKAINSLRYYPNATQWEEDTIENKRTTPTMENGGAEPRERVYFNAFLSRMAFMIQGRYPTEVLRSTFYAVLELIGQKKCSADGAMQHQHILSETTEESTRRTGSLNASINSGTSRTAVKHPSCSNSSTTSSSSSSSSSSGNNGILTGATNSLITPANVNGTVLHACPRVNSSRSACCAAPNDNSVHSTELYTLMHSVPFPICVEEGLWRGLGMPVSKAEVTKALHMIGIPVDENYEFHMNDFVQLVTALTGQNSVYNAGERPSPWLTCTITSAGMGTSSIGKEGSFMRLSTSYRKDRFP